MIGKISRFIFLIILLFGVSCDVGPNRSINSDNGYEFLQVPSPEWADQILYFIVTDRVMDGDSSNNDQGTGEYKKGDGGFWNGGDIKGITQKIDYLQELGVTGVWITPPVANQWRNPQQTGTGNHGYWANRLDQVDKHLGDLGDYKILSATLHSKGMYLIQDVVVNHFGDFYTYDGPYDPEDVSKNFKLHDVEQPKQYPFNHNDARKEEDRALGIYHFAPSFTAHSDTFQKTQFQYADLDDLNTSNPLVRDALRKNFGYWIEEVGVDGFRFDTPHMVEHDFWHNFLHDKEGDHLGIDLLAKQLGKEHFLTAGEVAFFPKPFDHSGTKEARKYLGTKKKPEMNSILNFPLNTAINRVFIEKKPTSTLSFRMKSIQENFQRSDQLLNFIDNHDAARLLSKSDRQTMRQALLFIMTIPGVPVIYYGTEQELTGMRQTMFKGGVGSIDKDHFDTENAYFKFVRGLIKLRKSNEVFRRGKLKILRDNSYGPGLFVYEMKLDDVTALILINTSANLQLIDGLSVPAFSPGNYVSKYSIGVGNEILSVSNDRVIDMILDAKSAQVYLNTGDYSQTKLDLHGTIELNNDFSDGNKLLKIDTKSNAITGTFDIGKGPTSLAIYNNNIYVANTFYDENYNAFYGSSRLDKIDQEIDINYYGSGVVCGGDVLNYTNKIFRSYSGGAAILDEKLNIVENTKIGDYTPGQLYSAEIIGNYIYFGLTNYTDFNKVKVVDFNNNEVGSFDVGIIPGDFAYWTSN